MYQDLYFSLSVTNVALRQMLILNKLGILNSICDFKVVCVQCLLFGRVCVWLSDDVFTKDSPTTVTEITIVTQDCNLGRCGLQSNWDVLIRALTLLCKAVLKIIRSKYQIPSKLICLMTGRFWYAHPRAQNSCIKMNIRLFRATEFNLLVICETNLTYIRSIDHSWDLKLVLYHVIN